MASYELTRADRRPVPASYRTEPRHLGYDEQERKRPFALYFRPDVRPVQGHVGDALLAGPAPAEYGYEVDDAPSRLSAPGYHKLETGWTVTERGTHVVSCLTDMPGVTAPMWDWWFGWHGRDTARYKLWHPDAHRFAALGEDRSADRTLSDRQRYVGNVSYVDEYVGAELSPFAIRFVDPARMGFEDRPGRIHVVASVGRSDLPVAAGWLVHQVRPTGAGCEMRSRFFLGHGRILALPARALTNRAAAALGSRPARILLPPVVSRVSTRITAKLGRDLLVHCATEMNHLAGFLPALHAEFRDMP